MVQVSPGPSADEVAAEATPGLSADEGAADATPIILARPSQGQPPKQGLARFMNKGDLFNVLTLLVLIVGIVLELTVFDKTTRRYNFVLAFGVFGFAGGITNWLAVKMLFDRIPGLIGSGVIPNHFKDIRRAVKDAIMESFFDEVFLRHYLKKMAPGLISKMDFGSAFASFVQKPEFDEQMAKQLEELSLTPHGAMLAMMKPMFGGSFAGFVPMMKPILLELAQRVGGMVRNLDFGEVLDVAEFRKEIDRMMEEKLLLLTSDHVKGMLEDVIRQHLGWLVIWGNVFGGLIGIVALAASGRVA